jgi:hypothetical protein
MQVKKQLKVQPKELPQIDALRDHDRSTKYANSLLDDLLKNYTLIQIAAHTGICKRNISYMRHRGINTFPMQLALEALAGRRVIGR